MFLLDTNVISELRKAGDGQRVDDPGEQGEEHGEDDCGAELAEHGHTR